MNTDTRFRILRLIQDKEKIRAVDLIETLQISRAMIHRHLHKLLEEKLILRIGSPPLVFYVPNHASQAPEHLEIESHAKEFLHKNYLYVSPDGKFLEGLTGFQEWLKNTKQTKNIKSLLQEYQNIFHQVYDPWQNKPFIDGSVKFQQTFQDCSLDHVFYKDFYSIPKFGKTKLGQLVLYGKQAQDKKIIKEIFRLIEETILKICDQYSIQAIAWIPHSLPRKTQFLKELSKHCSFPFPNISIVKAYEGDVPVAQKTLNKLEERIQNARNTIFIKNKEVPYKSILLIDDAVGSGATLHEVAKKLKKEFQVKKVIGFAIVGSYKGFEVIKEV